MGAQMFCGRIGPPGRHVATLDDVADITNEIGPAYQFTFRVVDGPHKGCVFQTTTGRALMGGTALGDLLDQLYGRKLVEGDVVDFAELIGREYELIARPGKSTGGIFQSVSPVARKAGE